MSVYSICAGETQEAAEKAPAAAEAGDLSASGMQFPMKQPFGTLLACPYV